MTELHALETLDDAESAALRGLDELVGHESTYGRIRGQWDALANGTDGRSDLMRAATMEELRPKLDEAEEKAVETADRLYQVAEQAWDVADNAAVLPTLRDAEMEQAATRREFVREEVSELSADELLDRIRFAQNRRDRVGLWLYVRYGGSRLTALQGRELTERQRAAESELQGVLARIEAELADPQVQETKKRAMAVAERLRGRADALRQSTYQYQRELAAEYGVSLPGPAKPDPAQVEAGRRLIAEYGSLGR